MLSSTPSVEPPNARRQHRPPALPSRQQAESAARGAFQAPAGHARSAGRNCQAGASAWGQMAPRRHDRTCSGHPRRRATKLFPIRSKSVWDRAISLGVTEPRGWPGQAHGCPVRGSRLQWPRPTRFAGSHMLLRLAFPFHAKPNFSSRLVAEPERICDDQPSESISQVFAKLLRASKLLVRLGFWPPRTNRTAVGQARP